MVLARFMQLYERIDFENASIFFMNFDRLQEDFPIAIKI